MERFVAGTDNMDLDSDETLAVLANRLCVQHLEQDAKLIDLLYEATERCDSATGATHSSTTKARRIIYDRGQTPPNIFLRLSAYTGAGTNLSPNPEFGIRDGDTLILRDPSLRWQIPR